MLRFHLVPREVKRGVSVTRPPNPIVMCYSEFDPMTECAAEILLSEWTGRITFYIA